MNRPRTAEFGACLLPGTDRELVRRQALLLQDIPYFPGGDGNIDVAHANVGEGVDDGVDDGLWRADGRRFTDAFGADGVVRRGCDRAVGLPGGRLHRGGDQVVLEVDAERVAVLVIGDFLEHGGGESLRQAPVNLPFNHHRVDDGAAVINGQEATDMHLAGTPVDIDDADVAAEGVGQVGRVVVVDGFQTRLQIGRAVGVGGEGQLLDGLALARRPLDVEAARLPFQVFLADFQQVGGNLLRLVAYLARLHRRCRARDGRAAAGIGAEAVGGGIGIAMLDIHIIRRHAEFGGYYLGEGGFMALPLRLHADTRQHFTRWMHSNLAAIKHLNACNIE